MDDVEGAMDGYSRARAINSLDCECSSRIVKAQNLSNNLDIYCVTVEKRIITHQYKRHIALRNYSFGDLCLWHNNG